jgi:hypothetical protein
VPVDLDGSGDVSRFVEEHVFVRFDDDQTGFAEVRCEPIRGDEPSGLGVLGELLG